MMKFLCLIAIMIFAAEAAIDYVSTSIAEDSFKGSTLIQSADWTAYNSCRATCEEDAIAISADFVATHQSEIANHTENSECDDIAALVTKGLAGDEDTLQTYGGIQGVRSALGNCIYYTGKEIQADYYGCINDCGSSNMKIQVPRYDYDTELGLVDNALNGSDFYVEQDWTDYNACQAEVQRKCLLVVGCGAGQGVDAAWISALAQYRNGYSLTACPTFHITLRKVSEESYTMTNNSFLDVIDELKACLEELQTESKEYEEYYTGINSCAVDFMKTLPEVEVEVEEEEIIEETPSSTDPSTVVDGEDGEEVDGEENAEEVEDPDNSVSSSSFLCFVMAVLLASLTIIA